MFSKLLRKMASEGRADFPKDATIVRQKSNGTAIIKTMTVPFFYVNGGRTIGSMTKYESIWCLPMRKTAGLI